PARRFRRCNQRHPAGSVATSGRRRGRRLPGLPVGIRYSPRHAFRRAGGARPSRRRKLRESRRPANSSAGSGLAGQPQALRSGREPSATRPYPVLVRAARPGRPAATRLPIAQTAQGPVAVGSAPPAWEDVVNGRVAGVLWLHTLVMGIAGFVFFLFPTQAAT